MYEQLFEEPDKEFLEARNALADSCDNPIYVHYANNAGPLELHEVDGTERNPQLDEVVARYGWPDEFDRVIQAPMQHSSDEEFLLLLANSVPIDLGGNVFIQTLQAPPIGQFSDVVRGTDVHGMMPHAHRAYAVAPDMFTNLRSVIHKTIERYRHFRRYDLKDDHVHVPLCDDYSQCLDSDPLLAAYMQPEYQDVRKALHMAYQIMSRLIKVDDPMRIDLSPDRRVSRILNAHEALMGHWDS